MAKDTKSRILDAALVRFSEKGYEGTNIREVAESLGLGKSSLYRHFISKEEIWNTLIDELIRYYEERFGSVENLPPIPQTAEELRSMTMRLINFTIHDEKIIRIRKILLTEQFRDDRVCELATRYFHANLEEMFAKIFSGMMDRGILKKDDPGILAFSYTAPISSLVQLHDREPKREREIMEKLEQFITHFISVYEIRREPVQGEESQS